MSPSIEIYSLPGFSFTHVLSYHLVRRFKSKENELKYVLRCATPNEVRLVSYSFERIFLNILKLWLSVCRFIEEKFQEESVLLKICRSKVKQRKLNMSIIDAEYQFDRHKLTFYFEVSFSINFSC